MVSGWLLKTPNTVEDFSVLVSVRNPLNIGAAARAVANFGLGDFRLVDPFSAAFREAVSAVGSAHVLQSARVFGTLLAEAVGD